MGASRVLPTECQKNTEVTEGKGEWGVFGCHLNANPMAHKRFTFRFLPSVSRTGAPTWARYRYIGGEMPDGLTFGCLGVLGDVTEVNKNQ